MTLEQKTIESQLHGEYNFSNIGAAVALGKFFDLNLEQIKTGINSYKSKNNHRRTY